MGLSVSRVALLAVAFASLLEARAWSQEGRPPRGREQSERQREAETRREDRRAAGGERPGRGSDFLSEQNGNSRNARELQERLRAQETLRAARRTEAARIIEQAHTRTGNYGLGSASRAESRTLGEAFVGAGYVSSVNGPGREAILYSRDGLRIYRPPTRKEGQSTAAGRPVYEANFQRYAYRGSRDPVANGHLTMTD